MGNAILPVLGAVGGFMLGGLGGGIKGAVLGNAIGNLFGGKKKQAVNLPTQEGSRLSDLRVQISSYGEVIPKVYGQLRLAGNIIWATDIKELETKDFEEYGEGIRKVINYSYSVSLAIAICEGEIEEIVRIWADGTLITEAMLRSSNGKFNVHLGTEEQLPDDIIGKHKPANTYPAYRGLCYVVFEDLPLAEFGNHIPNFTFEVKKKALIKPSVEDKIKEIVLIPGAGEFVYSSQIHYKQYHIKIGKKIVDKWGKNYLNMHNYSGKANMLLSIEQMAKTLPNLEWVAVVVTWFATSSNAGNCRVVPKIEFNNKDTAVMPHDWQVAGIIRSSAETVLYFDEYTPTYGGTPSDHTILEICNHLKERGYKIMLYPMIFVDEIKPHPKVWRGRIKANNTNDIVQWFNKNQGYNNFILHYANLTNGLIDAFIIGSELIGLTSFTDKAGSYPAVDQLVNLASLVKNKLGSNSLVTYAADWSEYHHTEGGWFNLDPLWASPNIDFIGIDAYFPLTGDLPQKQITEELIKSGWGSGEGWEYYWDPTRSQKHYFNDPKYAWKNIEYWWSNRHHNPDGTQTNWQPKLKPIWFTEFGFPSVDCCSNQPNVFYDPASVESHFPRGSSGKTSFYAQRQALNATLDYWQNKNEHETNLVSKRFVWCYDVRPFPFFPDLKHIWQDGDLWATGHWLNGKLGNSNLAAIVADILQATGLKPGDYDVSRLTDEVSGYIISQHITAREAIEQLQSAYFFDCVESDGILKFIHRTDGLLTTEIAESELVPGNNNDIKETLEITVAQELELPQKVSVSHIDRGQNYDTLTVESQRQIVSTRDQINFSLPIVLDNSIAKQIADITLYNSWQERINYKLTLPPKYAYLEPTDIINIICQNATHSLRIIKTDMQRTGQMKILAVSFNISMYDFSGKTNYLPTKYQLPKPLANSILWVIDAPPLNDNNANQAVLTLAVNSDDTNWSGAIIYYSHETENYKPITAVNTQSTTGFVLNKISLASPLLFDESTEIIIQLLYGKLQSVNELALLNGANKALIGEELIQFQNAELIKDQKYKLTRLLRGRQGTEWAINSHKIGDKFILLNKEIINISIPNNLIGKAINYKAVTIGKTLAETESVTFTYTGRALKPFASVYATVEKDADGNIKISWLRRSRIDNDWRDYVDIPIGEDIEKYEIDIKKKNKIIRTLETTTPNVIYPKEQILSDFTKLPDNLTATIYQLSSQIGRGYGTIIAI
ncbi:baseplate multidomain protein megatron [Rickettsia endosymbiont of Orchestes rusci]|uniref:baseplate multidomain protein megatron n=1 Tax=Rickettsia endosymbiont of Orchestes rusci TaxID=3066250 RepID=UPI00313E96B1